MTGQSGKAVKISTQALSTDKGRTQHFRVNGRTAFWLWVTPSMNHAGTITKDNNIIAKHQKNQQK